MGPKAKPVKIGLTKKTKTTDPVPSTSTTNPASVDLFEEAETEVEETDSDEISPIVEVSESMLRAVIPLNRSGEIALDEELFGDAVDTDVDPDYIPPNIEAVTPSSTRARPTSTPRVRTLASTPSTPSTSRGLRPIPEDSPEGPEHDKDARTKGPIWR